MYNSSVIAIDHTRNLYAMGYRHGGEAVTALEIIDSSLVVKEDNQKVTPMEFLAEWHRLNLTSWDNPSETTREAFEKLDDMAEVDEFHYEVILDDGRVKTITGFEKGSKIFYLEFF